MRFEFSAGTIVYVIKDRRPQYLFLKRREGWLDIPKGHIEAGESEVEAALRETREESGLEVELERFFRHDTQYWFVERGERVRKHLSVFLARVEPGSKVDVSSEHVGYVWLDFEAAMAAITYSDQKRIMEDANGYVLRSEGLRQLNFEYAKLPEKHRDWRLSRKLVPGEGPANARIMFLGQAPGANEDLLGRPFVGAAGKLLDSMLPKAGLRRRDVYITSVVQFFPPANREPTNSELELCMPFFERQVAIVRPELLVLLGNFAAKAVLGVGNVSRRHGLLVEKTRLDCKAFVMYHPAAAVRLKKLVPVLEKDFERLGQVVTSSNP